MYAGALVLIFVGLFSAFSAVPTIQNDATSDAETLLIKAQAGQKSNQIPKPFLTLPFAEADAPRDILQISEGWYYSPEEEKISNKSLHRGIDFSMPRGTPVVAAADGYAVRSFQVADTDEVYQGKTIGFSLGEFVQIWHSEQKVYTLYGHLNKASDDIAYAKTEQLASNTWEPTGIYAPVDEIMQKATFVKRGQVIGYVGDSGIGWGYSDTFDLSTKHIVERDYNTFPSWDETHLHFEVYTRTADGRAKQTRFDPFGLYDQVRDGRNPYQNSANNPQNLWQLNKSGQPAYSK